MAKKRMISQQLIFDKEFNSLSEETQNVFVRMLAISDDFGIVTADDYSLAIQINKTEEVTAKAVKEITIKKLGVIFYFNSKPYFMFKAKPFDEFQNFIVGKRTKSECLKLPTGTMANNDFFNLIEIDANDIPLIEREIKIAKFAKKTVADEILFEKLYEAYPHSRRISRIKAKESFNKINPDKELFEKMLQGLEQHIRSKQWNKDDGQFIPLITTWLNQRRWEEKLEEIKNSSDDLTVDSKYKIES